MACADDYKKFAEIAGANTAHSQAYYACKYLESVEKTNIIRQLLAGAKVVLDAVIADRTYDLQKSNLERLNKITEQQLAQSADLHGQWAYGKACERAQLDAACNTNIPEPNYQAIYSRVASVIAAQFGNARRKVKKTYSVYCQAAACSAMRQLYIDEAITVAAAVEAAYRKSEANWKIETAAARTHLLQVLQHMRGLLAATGGLLSGATASAQAAASINPYQGFQYAGQQALSTLTGFSMESSRNIQAASQINGMNAFNSSNLNLGRAPSESPLSTQSPSFTGDYNSNDEMTSLLNRYPTPDTGSSDPFSLNYENEFDKQSGMGVNAR